MRMSETLQSVLCQEEWHWDSIGERTIRFRQDGTGELICRGNLNVWIAAEFEWKFLSADAGNSVVDLSKTTSKTDNQTATDFSINMTLTKRRISDLGPALDNYRINEDLLTDEAFIPKTYSISLEKGNFKTPFDIIVKNHPEVTPRWDVRITFDPSPYPPREEWKDEPADTFWEWKTFCGRMRDPEPASKGFCNVQ